MGVDFMVNVPDAPLAPPQVLLPKDGDFAVVEVPQKSRARWKAVRRSSCRGVRGSRGMTFRRRMSPKRV